MKLPQRIRHRRRVTLLKVIFSLLMVFNPFLSIFLATPASAEAGVDEVSPVVTISNPSFGETTRSTNVRVRGAVMDDNLLDYRLRIKEVATDTVVYNSGNIPSASFTTKLLYVWDDLLVADGEYKIILRARDVTGNTSNSSVSIFVDNTSPTITPIQPLTDYSINGDYSFEAISDDMSGVVKVQASFKNLATDVMSSQYDLQYTAIDSKWILDVDTMLFPDGLYNVRFRAEDTVGNYAGETSLRVLIDNSIPAVSDFHMYVNGTESRLAKEGDLVRVTVNVEDEFSGVEFVRIVGRERPYEPNQNELFSSTQMTPLGDGLYDYQYIVPATYLGGNEINEHVSANYYGIRVKDTLGNVETPLRENFTLDNTPPDVLLESPVNGSFITGIKDVVGSVIEPNLLRYYLVVENSANSKVAGPGTVYSTGPILSETMMTWDTTLLPEGEYEIRLEARDLLDQKDAGSVSSSFVKVDHTVPVSVFTAPTVGGLFNKEIQLSGNTSDNYAVHKVYLSYSPAEQDTWSPIATLTTAPTTSYDWNYGWTPSVEGVYDLRVQAEDYAGNLESTDYVIGITYDVTSPDAPTMTSIYKGHNPATMTKVLTCGVGNGYTNSPQITIDWTENTETDFVGYWLGTKTNSHHKFVTDSKYLANMTPGRDPYWYSVIAVDAAGNESPMSTCGNLFLDTDTPESDITIQGDLQWLQDVLGNDGWVRDGFPIGWYQDFDEIRVAVSSLAGNSPDFINYFIDPLLGACPLQNSNKYAVVPKGTNLASLINSSPDGEYKVCYFATDRSGNVESSVNSEIVKKDDLNPNFVLDMGSIPGNLHEGVYYVKTNDIGVTLEVTDDHSGYTIIKQTLHQVTRNSAGDYVCGDRTDLERQSFIPPVASGIETVGFNDLADGMYCLKVLVRDGAQNASAIDESGVKKLLFSVDTQPPKTPMLVSPEDGSATKGVYFEQHWENILDANQYMYESCSVEPGDTGDACSSVKYTNTYSTNMKSVGAGQPNSRFWWRVKSVDLAGNMSDWSESYELIIDNNGPEVLMHSYDYLTMDASNMFTGNATDVFWAGIANVEYKLIDSTSSTVQDWTSAVPANGTYDEISEDFSTPVSTSLSDGMYTLLVRGIDNAGNIGEVVESEFVIDTTAPSSEFYKPVDVTHHNGPIELDGMTSDVNGVEDVTVYAREYLKSTAAVPFGDVRTGPWIEVVSFDNPDRNEPFSWNGVWTPDSGTFACVDDFDGCQFDLTVSGTDNTGNVEALFGEPVRVLIPEEFVDEVVYDNFVWNVYYDIVSPLFTVQDVVLSEIVTSLPSIGELTISENPEALTIVDCLYTPSDIVEYQLVPNVSNLTVSDAGMCYVMDNAGNISESYFDVTVENSPISNAVFTQPSANELTIVPSGGNAPYVYVWSDDCIGTGNTATLETAVGVYSCSAIVTDSDGDTYSKTFNYVIEEEGEVLGTTDSTTGEFTSTGSTTTGGSSLVFGANAANSGEVEGATEEDGDVKGESEVQCEDPVKYGGYIFYDEDEDGIVDDSEEVFENVKVNIVSEDGNFKVSATTDKNGYWEVKLCEGDYSVEVDKDSAPDGYEVPDKSDITVGTDAVSDYNLTLAKTSDEGFDWKKWLVWLGGAIVVYFGYREIRKRMVK